MEKFDKNNGIRNNVYTEANDYYSDQSNVNMNYLEKPSAFNFTPPTTSEAVEYYNKHNFGNNNFTNSNPKLFITSHLNNGHPVNINNNNNEKFAPASMVRNNEQSVQASIVRNNADKKKQLNAKEKEKISKLKNNFKTKFNEAKNSVKKLMALKKELKDSIEKIPSKNRAKYEYNNSNSIRKGLNTISKNIASRIASLTSLQK